MSESVSLSSKVVGVSTKGANGVNENLDLEWLDEKGDKDMGVSRFWEWQRVTGEAQVTHVQGRLGACVTYWQEVLHAFPTVIDWIQNGYKLPLLYAPTRLCGNNHRSAIENKEFVTEALEELMQNHCVRKYGCVPYICSPLSVVSNSEGKLRLVLNLRHLNQFLRKDKFKYEDLRVATLLFEKEDFLFKFDLKSGYHHLSIFEEHQKYLGFGWELEGVLQYFVFTVLPFGLSSACYAFKKLMRPVVRHWRGGGLRAIV